MVTEEKNAGQAEALKVISTQRLLAKLETAFRNGRLKPINPAVKPSVEEVRVKAK